MVKGKQARLVQHVEHVVKQQASKRAVCSHILSHGSKSNTAISKTQRSIIPNITHIIKKYVWQPRTPFSQSQSGQ